MLKKLRRRQNVHLEDLDDERRQEMIRYIESEHPELKALSKSERKEFIIRYFQEREVEKRIKLKDHLEVFNDAVLAIIITIIVLNLPMPKNHSTSSVMGLLETVGVYFVSFIVVANFWLMHHFIFSKIKTGINETLVVIDFLFMAEVSLLPFLTKWMETDRSCLPVMVYGFVYLSATVTLVIMSMKINSRVKVLYPKLYRQLNRTEKVRLMVMLPINIFLIILSYWFPQTVFLLYIVMPVLTFLSYVFEDDEERRFEAHLEVVQHQENQDVSQEVVQHIGEHIETVIEDKMKEIVQENDSDDTLSNIDDENK